MKMTELKSKIHGLISQNLLDIALDELINWGTINKDFELQKNLIILKSRYERVKQQERLGIMNYTDALKEQSFMAHSILDFVQRLDKSEGKSDIYEENNMDKRKTILFLASNPTNQAKLQLEKEFVRISTSLQEGVIEHRIVAEWAVTPNALQQAILKHRPNFIHFSGHGEDGDQSSGGIVLNDSEGKAKLVHGEALENMFNILSRKLEIEIVLLNSCYSEEQANGISKFIPHVIGMNDSINDEAAIEFSTGFYRGLAQDDDVKFAFDLAVNMIQLENMSGDDVPILLSKSTIKQ